MAESKKPNPWETAIAAALSDNKAHGRKPDSWGSLERAIDATHGMTSGKDLIKKVRSGVRPVTDYTAGIFASALGGDRSVLAFPETVPDQRRGPRAKLEERVSRIERVLRDHGLMVDFPPAAHEDLGAALEEADEADRRLRGEPPRESGGTPG